VTYAAQTTVSAEKSRAEIENILKRYGASHFGYASTPEKAVIGFQANGRMIRFSLPMPTVADFKRYKRRQTDSWTSTRTDTQAQAAHEQAQRQRWRALTLCIKAKLEAVEAKISTFEEEFMAQIVLPNGETMAEHALPYIAQAYEQKSMPPLLGFGA
jgi:hypothetical protein